MSTPEPVDERPAGGIEIRGGDRDEDFMPGQQELPFAKGGLLTADPGEDSDEVPAPLRGGH
jgi:hypothetical protein